MEKVNNESLLVQLVFNQQSKSIVGRAYFDEQKLLRFFSSLFDTQMRYPVYLWPENLWFVVITGRNFVS